ncbi:MAG: GTPase [Chloroflexi bacterium]|nr:GTPase [Chloroflexota bacterium]
MDAIRVVIMGAGGRDFHNFNTCFRDNPRYEVVAFTAAQIPGLAGRLYPPTLAGRYYSKGIPIVSESELPRLIKDFEVDEVVFAYSDVSHEHVMHAASLVASLGADFRLMGPKMTMLKASVPVVAVCAVRTGAGKSQTARRVSAILRELGYNVVVVRHPMAYGELAQEVCQRFALPGDLDKYGVTIEEREEYEAHIDNGVVVYAGVDYKVILEAAQGEADIIIWDGGNNDIPFYKPDLHIVVADPLRAGHERLYYPGEANFRMADVIVINKVNAAKPEDVEIVRENARALNPNALVVLASSPVEVDKPELVSGRKVLVVEDGPTLTHGGMCYGAGVVAAQKLVASEIVDPRPYAVGSIIEVYRQFPQLGPALPAMGYGKTQIAELQETINGTPADTVVVATPIDLRRVISVDKPVARVRYELQELTKPDLSEVIAAKFGRK